MKKKRGFFFGLCIVLDLLIILSQQPLLAQTKETPDSVRFKALGCMFRAIKSVNDRNVRLQGLQKELDAMQPLAPQNMDSTHFALNLIQVGKYLRFLQSHREELAKNLHAVTDSIRLLEKLMNSEEEKKALEEFLIAYREESSAFTGYSQRLSLMVTDIRSALTFLQTVPMTRKGNDVTFNTDKSANEKYLDYESKISVEQSQVDVAIDKTVKLSEKENKAIQLVTDILNK
jgi:hypothetical protein